ncbi:MAG: 4-hydroxy-tetrahydrodipicolinate reductase [Marinifilaceae bacterium]|nr:4-hydroxy-tetrahydrodipicolinate reductase [Marinifilaceae bacterium]
MKVALLGYGKMGQLIAKILEEQGDEVVLKVDIDNRDIVTDEELKRADVAIEFSMPKVAVDNYKWCFDCGVPVVSGTTGWLERWNEVIQYCNEKKGAFFYASNYSIGVNLFFHLNRYLAKVMSQFKEYGILLEETHHIHKLDAPSGTAITIAEGILENNDGYESWKLVDDYEASSKELPIVAHRIGEVPGIHKVTYKSGVDEISIEHSAYSREGFAKGAVAAAKFMVGKCGVYSMEDLLKF